MLKRFIYIVAVSEFLGFLLISGLTIFRARHHQLPAEDLMWPMMVTLWSTPITLVVGRIAVFTIGVIREYRALARLNLAC